jgi:hypothetical protein
VERPDKQVAVGVGVGKAFVEGEGVLEVVGISDKWKAELGTAPTGDVIQRVISTAVAVSAPRLRSRPSTSLGLS